MSIQFTPDTPATRQAFNRLARVREMAIAIGLLVITNLFTGYLLLGTHYRFKALVLYIVKKGYTPPTKDELTECIKECVREKL